ncbi:MAG: hypothetical protein HYX93_03965 [Chloroflexi bacterium]|nr:hypothetical protein [Chloroflexota bacterium]
MLKHALFGLGVSLLCLLPPLIHFVSGPLGPLIGGWLAGSRAEASPGQAVGIGSVMGLLMALPVGAALVVDSVRPSLIPWVDGNVLLALGIAMLGYTTFLGTLGAVIGGYMASHSKQG